MSILFLQGIAATPVIWTEAGGEPSGNLGDDIAGIRGGEKGFEAVFGKERSDAPERIGPIDIAEGGIQFVAHKARVAQR